MNEEYIGKSCDYFNSFVKDAILQLKNKGTCYVYHKDHVEAIKKAFKKKIEVIETDFGYSLTVSKK